jgi:hypothetical protein
MQGDIERERGLDRRLAYEFNGDLGREGKDISAGDDARARFLQRALDAVDHREAARRVVVRWHVLLGLDRREVVVQKKGAIATLKANII